MVEEMLDTRLKNHPGLAALVGDRIYPFKAPEGLKGAFCVYLLTAQERQYSHNGYSGLDDVRVQVIAVAGNYLLSKQIAAQVTDAIEPWGKRTGVDEEFLPEAGLYQVNLEFQIWYKEGN